MLDGVFILNISTKYWDVNSEFEKLKQWIWKVLWMIILHISFVSNLFLVGTTIITVPNSQINSWAIAHDVYSTHLILKNVLVGPWLQVFGCNPELFSLHHAALWVIKKWKELLIHMLELYLFYFNFILCLWSFFF